MCGFTCRMFGAPYEDAVCIDGQLWDLDSHEDGLLTSGGDIACPSCATDRWLGDILSSAREDIPQNASEASPAEVWERGVRYAMGVNQSSAINFLSRLASFDLLDHKGRVDSPETPWDEAECGDEDIVNRRWPWPIPGLSQHDMLAIHPRGDGRKREPEFDITPLPAAPGGESS